jgi:hypothetical protein
MVWNWIPDERLPLRRRCSAPLHVLLRHAAGFVFPTGRPPLDQPLPRLAAGDSDALLTRFPSPPPFLPIVKLRIAGWKPQDTQNLTYNKYQ